MPMPIKAVFFDMGGTIDTFRYTRDYRIANAHFFRECLQREDVSLNLTDEQIADLITGRISDYHCWNRASHIELPSSEIWSKYIFHDLEANPAVFEKIGEELSLLYEIKYYLREPRPEVPAVLQAIKEMGLRIGCVSNTPSIGQVPHNLTEYGIREYFDPIVLSSEYGRRKPDPSIFYYAARQANLPTGACAFVGDKINRDILGARRAGYRLAVQIRHIYDDGDPDTGAIPDAVINSMDELLPILEQAMREDKIKTHKHNGHRIKAIFFDAGDILYFRPQKNQNLNRFLEGKVTSKPPDFEVEAKRIRDLAFSGKLARHEYYRELLHLYGLTDPELVKEGMEAISLDDDTVAIPEGVPETVNTLKERGFILGIITDTAMPFARKLNWFDQHGFGRVWDVVISSKELGVRKPDPSMYKEAISQTGIRVHEAVFVGHKTSELEGARAIGLKTIAFNYDADARADVYLDKFEDLLCIPLLSDLQD